MEDCNEFIHIIERDVRFDRLREEYLRIKGYPEEIVKKESVLTRPTSYRIEHKENKIPPIHFLNKEEMMIVYNLLKKGHMRFGSCEL